jgi:voltage-gated sodium channel
MKQEEPKRSGPLANFVEGPFDQICTLVIVLNAIATFFSTNWQVQNWDQKDSVFYKVVDVVFVIFYSTELVLKLALHRGFYFWNDNARWNSFDFFLVCSGIYDQLSFLIMGSNGVDLVFLRILRLLKLAKILRVFRLVRSLSVLRLFLNCLLGSMASLFWSIVMMVIIFFMFGLVFVQNTASYLAANADSLPAEEYALLAKEFGSVQDAMIGLFMSTTGGNDWSRYYEVLVPVGTFTSFTYLFFVAFSQIALMNILTGIFVENAMSLAVPDRQAMFSEETKKYMNQLEELEAIVKKLDTENDGFITHDEFRRGMTDSGRESLLTYLGAQGVHSADAEHFYKLLSLAHSTPKVEIAAFVGGCMKLRGDAQSLDLQALIFEMKVVHKKINAIYTEMKGSSEYELGPVCART